MRGMGGLEIVGGEWRRSRGRGGGGRGERGRGRGRRSQRGVAHLAEDVDGGLGVGGEDRGRVRHLCAVHGSVGSEGQGARARVQAYCEG
jgi:hypothetical protein